MKSTDDWRALPAGIRWIDVEGEDYSLLCPVDDAPRTDNWFAMAYPDGRWFARYPIEAQPKGRATPRHEESLSAAAQREAEAALWRADGFGMGEVRGLRIDGAAIESMLEAMDAGASVVLPGLHGLWRVVVVGGSEGGPYVDAARPPEEPAPLPWNWCPTCKQEVDIEEETFEGGEERCDGCGGWYDVRCDGDGVWSLEARVEHDVEGSEPAPRESSAPTWASIGGRPCGAEAGEPCAGDVAEGDAVRAPSLFDLGIPASVSAEIERMADGLPAVDAVRAPAPGDLCPACGAMLPPTGIGCESCGWMGEELPGDAEREPSAPADDDELTRLLPKAHEALAQADRYRRRGMPIHTTMGGMWDVLARACSLLLAERERLISEHDGVHEEARVLRARVAEMEAERAAALALLEAEPELGLCQGVVLALRLARHEATATPPPGTVAALLRAVEDAASASAASAAKTEAEDGEDAADYQSGHAHGIREAASLIRATLGAPSPLDGVVAEVCAPTDGGKEPG